MTSGIYKLSWYTEGQELVYIGQSVDVDRRIKEHTRAMRAGTHSNNLIQIVYNTLGDPQVDLLVSVPRNELNAAEAYFIKLYNSNSSDYGLNKTAGGGSRDGGPMYNWTPRMPQETDNGLSEALRKRGVVPLYEKLIFNRWVFAVLVIAVLLATGVIK